MEEPNPMPHQRIESLSSLTTPNSSDARGGGGGADAQATSDPAKRVQEKRFPAAQTASSTNLDDEAPNSQGSHVTSSSRASGVGKLPSESSNLSNLSLPLTDDSSPLGLVGPFSQKSHGEHLQTGQRPLTPEVNNGDRSGSQGTSQSTSPISVDSRGLMRQGSKRTASGVVKPSTGSYSVQSQELRSLGTETNPKRISEISAQLKARLSYAMVKVQNGWEKHSIDELETLPSNLSAPATPITQSPYHARRLSAYSDASDRYIQSPGGQMSPPSQFSARFQPQAQHAYSPSNWQSAIPAVHPNSNGPSLAPAAPISSSRPNRRSMSARVPPNLNTAHLSYQAYGHPTTPTSAPARPGILRMPSGQAEKEALETLMFMSSPNNSGNARTSTAHPSPLRSEFPPSAKRVIFETQ
ncbi:hypothetical protein EJ08DRAFT_339765 [Tothia fuscella]|uniref:Uncharacterized protein n=1 Tax=Tothia fuscella TaxID=1048955 RepID=A0A9P4P2J3_9PEZI|nr:hypothetical protein EJ08DRAFT_339765 [Tothia fuscella]